MICSVCKCEYEHGQEHVCPGSAAGSQAPVWPAANRQPAVSQPQQCPPEQHSPATPAPEAASPNPALQRLQQLQSQKTSPGQPSAGTAQPRWVPGTTPPPPPGAPTRFVVPAQPSPATESRAAVTPVVPPQPGYGNANANAAVPPQPGYGNANPNVPVPPEPAYEPANEYVHPLSEGFLARSAPIFAPAPISTLPGPAPFDGAAPSTPNESSVLGQDRIGSRPFTASNNDIPAIRPVPSHEPPPLPEPDLFPSVQFASFSADGQLPGDNLHAEDVAEDTLDMKFHVEKHQDPYIGKLIADRYRIVSLVGRGGMGVVYKAEQTTIDRTVAIKMLHSHIIADAETVKRFHQEAKAVSRVEHAHSVKIYDFGSTDEAQPYIVMDYVDGGSLRELLQTAGPLSLKRTEDIFSQVTAALGCAHNAGIIHRDIKPENIMLCEKSAKPDFVYVVDFGISTLAIRSNSVSGQYERETRGSPAYMSPEQCVKGADIDHRTDIYSLAVSIYETLSGKLPYQARNAFELLDAHKNAAPIPLLVAHPSLSACESLSNVLNRAMEKQPEKRPQTMDEFAADLAEAFKRDSIRMGYLKNRKEELSQASIEAISGDTDPSEYERTAGETTGSRGKLEEQFTSGIRIVRSVIGSITGNESEELPDISGKIKFTNCPRCNEPVDGDIAFCLACGRSLATTHEFARLRAAQGVFSLPRASGADAYSGQVPTFKQGKNERRLAVIRFLRLLLIPVIGVIIFSFWMLGLDRVIAEHWSHFLHH